MRTEWFKISNERQVASPALLIYPARIEENLRRMIHQAGGVSRLRPHVKTHKLPQVLAIELAHGITKFKAATIAECEMIASAGGPDVLMAYPLVGPDVLRFVELVQKFPRTTFTAMTDNAACMNDIAQAARTAKVTLNVMLDLDVGMHRTGIPPGDEAAEIYRQLGNTLGLRAAGLHAYDGHLRNTDHAKLVADTQHAFAAVWALRDRLRSEGLAVPKIVASGTPTFSLMAAMEEVEVGCGTTVLWDFGQAEACPDLDYLSAAVLLCRIVSKPTRERLCLDLGHKAVASEMAHPRVRLFGLEDAQFVVHSEEHLVIETKQADRFSVGQVLYGIPKHVCPTVALYSEVWAVSDGAAKERWEVTARRRRITI